MKYLLGLAALLGGASHELGRAMSEQRPREPHSAGRCRHRARRRLRRVDLPIPGASIAKAEIGYDDKVAVQPGSPGPRDAFRGRLRKTDLAGSRAATSPPTFVAVAYDAGPGRGPALLIYAEEPTRRARRRPERPQDEVIEGMARELTGRPPAAPRA